MIRLPLNTKNPLPATGTRGLFPLLNSSADSFSISSPLVLSSRRRIETKAYRNNRFIKACPELCRRVLYYGFLSHTHKETFNQVKYLLGALITLTLNPLENPSTNSYPLKDSYQKSDPLKCPLCGGTLRWLKAIPTGSRSPPLCKTS